MKHRSENITGPTGENSLAKVLKAARQRAVSEFGQPAIADELVSQVSLRLLEASLQGQPGPGWEKIYRREVESYFAELYAHCQRYAVRLVEDPEAAADICQDCLKELLSTRNKIVNVKAWICQVAHNKAVGKIRQERRDRTLLSELKSLPEIPAPDGLDQPAKMDKKQLRKLLSRADYSLWLRLCAHKTLKDYARAEGISYQTAKNRKRRVRMNLRSAWLRGQGWLDSSRVLNYDEFNAIRRFISRVLATYGTSSAKASLNQRGRIKNPSLEEAFKGVHKIHEWTVSLLDEGGFSLLLVGIRDGLPVPVKLKIKLDRAHRVRISDCQVYKLLASAPTGGARVLTEVGGRLKLRYEELLRLVPKFTVLDQERFDHILADLREQD